MKVAGPSMRPSDEGSRPSRPRLLEDPKLPVDLLAEVVPELKSVLHDCIRTDSIVAALLSYCVLWHPNLPHDLRNKHKNSVKRVQLSANALTSLVTQLASEGELIRLLADRGPDFGVSLLVIMDVCFQVAFCLRKPFSQQDSSAAAKRSGLQRVFHGCSKLLETLSLHLDCPPLGPHYHAKFALICVGFLFHRKLPPAAQSRFFQLHYFVTPEIRPLAFERQPLAWEAYPSLDPKTCFLPAPLMEALETHLWQTARALSLGQAVNLAEIAAGPSTPLKVTSRQTAMAVTFEVLNHLARYLFGTSLCLYGSAATGFATVDSDVDVVLQLGATGVASMMAEIAEYRQAGKPDLNPFPSRSSGGFQRALTNWDWVTEKPETTAATIWAGRKFAWACHRFLGWDVQCVQSAYVPIVRINACVDENGCPKVLPQALRPSQNLETRFLPNLVKWSRLARPGQDIRSLLLDDVLVPHPVLPVSPSIGKKKKQTLPLRANPLQHRAAVELVTQVAFNVIAENQYAHWKTKCFDDDLLPHAEAVAHEMLAQPVDDSSPHFAALLKVLIDFVTNKAACELTEDRTVLAEPGLWRAPPELLYDDGRLLKVDACTEEEDSEETEIWLVESDCSMDRAVGIHNSRLLRAYASCDSRVVALGLLIKHWARRREVGDAFAGYLSGYQWTLLVIHFLQHYLCLPAPDWLKTNAEFVTFQQKVTPRVPPRLPLLPNLQRPPSCLGPFEPVTVQELEGEADVFFYEPGVGQNHSLPRRLEEACRLAEASSMSPSEEVSEVVYKKFPEDELLDQHPAAYALSLLSCPFLLEGNDEEPSQPELWKCRAHTAPRPKLISKQKASESRRKWDAERARKRLRMVEPEDSTERRSSTTQRKQEPFPELDEVRSAQFDRDHLVTRESLIIPFGHDSVTLSELLYAFFEYYGMRFNYATEMSDIDRVPLLPSSKKEFFETSIFKPTMEVASEHGRRMEEHRRSDGEKSKEEKSKEGNGNHPSDSSKSCDNWDTFSEQGGSFSSCEESFPTIRENRGRGKGSYQFQGRHFLCIRDPFEKARTIGPMFRCQSHLSGEILSAMQTLAWVRVTSVPDLEESKNVIIRKVDKIFERKHSQAHLFHPVRDGLADLLTRCARLDKLGDEKAGEFGHIMYPELIDQIRRYGNYSAILNGRLKSLPPRQGEDVSPAIPHVHDPPPVILHHPVAPHSAPHGPGHHHQQQHQPQHQPHGHHQQPHGHHQPQHGQSPPPGFDAIEGFDGMRRAFHHCRMFSPNEGHSMASRILPGSGWRYFPGAKQWLERRVCLCEHTHTRRGGYPESRRVSARDLEMDRMSHVLVSVEASLPSDDWNPQQKRELEKHLLRMIQGRAASPKKKTAS